ncbi:MAG: sulfite exporter TauE/SafE family protein [Geminicoccaceae bacterium]|nr:MAG: sulfite exporter TauE/SafE family protein [Geminicoccaceae bacterium]
MSLDLLLVGLTLGLASSVHCLGMCGGITAALANAVPARIRQNPWRLSAHLLAIHGGRITSYALAGAVAGVVGAGAVAAISQPDALVVLRYAAAAFLIAIGFTVAGWLPLTDRLGKLALPVWGQLQPRLHRLAPGGPGSIAYGLVWGWLPCGMVYATLFYAVFAASALGGAGVMLAFGLGTVPALLALGLAAGRLRLAPTHAFWLRQLMGTLLVATALLSVWFGGPDGPFCH